jgi:glycogen operon protein
MATGEGRLQLGAVVVGEDVRFSVHSSTAERVWVSLFSPAGQETQRVELERGDGGTFSALVPGIGSGARYGFRADGDYDPPRGHWFDPDKLLMDPYAVMIDRPYTYDPSLSARRGEGGDTAELMPKAIVQALPEPLETGAPLFQPGGLIYELSVRAFSMRHPDIPEPRRGTVAALSHPCVIDHLNRLGVGAVELMPIAAWIDERHLPGLGLRNAWGYNPVSFMALDPRLALGGLAELRDTVKSLHQAGIGVILDVVFNHTGESDEFGPTLSLRGLDNPTYYRHTEGHPARLINDTGCGNTMRCDHPVVQDLIVDALRHFVLQAGVDGFRFDLATVLGRNDNGFTGEAELLARIRNDLVLRDRILVVEPWDVGPNGYQLGNFGRPFLEWNDRYRDDVRRFWRGDASMTGALATRLAGSSDIFDRDSAGSTRTLNFISAHDGMTVADLVSYETRHNEANGENNRDGHSENFSWNNGAEGKADDPGIRAARDRDARALLATLFASRGTIMLTAGDEFGRSQGGNNNSYAQDNDVTWLEWRNRDLRLEAFVSMLSEIRRANPVLAEIGFLTGRPIDGTPDVTWLTEAGSAMEERDWNDLHRRRLVMLLAQGKSREASCLAVLFNGDRRTAVYKLPGAGWDAVVVSCDEGVRRLVDGEWIVPGRSVVVLWQRSASTEIEEAGHRA